MLQSNLKETVDARATNLQKLLASPNGEAELIKLAQLISPNNQFTRDQDAMGVKIKKDEYKAKFNVTFTRNEIYQECLRYNLAFIQGQSYEGEYTIQFLKKLAEFLEEKNITASPDDLRTQIYVLAAMPNDVSGREMKYPAKDPLMFFRVEEGYFVLIDGSRNYITIRNWWRGFKNFDETQCRVAIILENFLVLLGLYLVLSTQWLHLSFWWITTTFAFALIGMLMRMGFRGSHREGFNHYNSHFNKNKYEL